NVWVRQEFCRTCELWRPLRSKHLKESGWCVEGFDHYCQLLGNVIGRGNYLAFIVLVHFLVLFTLEALVVLWACVLPDRQRANLDGYWLETLVFSPDLCCVAFLRVADALLALVPHRSEFDDERVRQEPLGRRGPTKRRSAWNLRQPKPL
ncbi:unnamed protein product, partial [Polarella glacialis]